MLPSLPPRCLLPYTYRQIAPADASLPRNVDFNSFELMCPCGNQEWHLNGYWFGNKEDFIGPLETQCTGCNAQQELIDTQKDGHDAEIGDSYGAQGTGTRTVWCCHECNSSAGRLIASFGYHFEPDAEVALRPQDYFDAFILTHVCKSKHGTVQVTMFDCA